MKYKLGLKPVEAQPTLRLCNYFTSALPSVTSLKYPLGHADLIKPQMFMNDQLGDCAIAGSIEEVRLVNALAGKTVNFTDKEAVENYTAITGYNPSNPYSDQGTDVHDLYQYRQQTGIRDADGKYHKITAYAGLTPGDFDELLIALSLFDMVGIGIEVPDYCEPQFEAGQPWHVVKGRHRIEGGHYIPGVGAQGNQLVDVFTWGAKTGMERTFYERFNTVAVVALTEEFFTADKSPEGVDMQSLANDLRALNTGRVMSEAPQVA